MTYKPYSIDWHRKRYLKEALDNYINNNIDNEIIFADIISILCERSEQAYAEFSKLNDLEARFYGVK